MSQRMFGLMRLLFVMTGMCVFLMCGPLRGHAQGVRLEAEEAQIDGDSLHIRPTLEAPAGTQKDYSGRGYVTGFRSLSDHLIFHLKLPQEGIYELALSYRTGEQRDYDISVNDGGVSGTLLPTPASCFWTAPAGKVELQAGDNVISVNRGWGDFDLDYLEFKSAGPLQKPPL